MPVSSIIIVLGVALASTLHLTPETMAEVWEAHSLNKQNLTELTIHQFEAYKNELVKASSTAPTPDMLPSSETASSSKPRGAAIVSRKREAPPATMVTPTSSAKRPKAPLPDAATSSVDRLAMEGTTVPSPVRSSSSAKGIASSVKITPVNLPKYEERTRVGHVVVSYPAGYDGANHNKAASKAGQKCIVTTNDGDANEAENGGNDNVTRYNVSKSYRHMFTTLEDRAIALEKHLVRTKHAIVEDIENEAKNRKKESNDDDAAPSFEEVNVPRQHPSTFVGRICNEAHNGKINSTSVVLEGSSSSCGGARVNVDLSHLEKRDQQLQPNGYSLFPGQIVAIEGINGTGRKITATKIREGASLPPATSSARAIRNHYRSDDGERSEQPTAPLKVISACGPFTTAKSMDYQPFIDLMHVVLEQTPDVVILMGPFVDTRQEAVQSGRVTFDDDEGEVRDMVVDYETVFSQRISALIEEVFEAFDEEKKLKTEFVLVPALEDATAKFV